MTAYVLVSLQSVVNFNETHGPFGNVLEWLLEFVASFHFIVIVPVSLIVHRTLAPHVWTNEKFSTWLAKYFNSRFDYCFDLYILCIHASINIFPIYECVEIHILTPGHRRASGLSACCSISTVTHMIDRMGCFPSIITTPLSIIGDAVMRAIWTGAVAYLLTIWLAICGSKQSQISRSSVQVCEFVEFILSHSVLFMLFISLVWSQHFSAHFTAEVFRIQLAMWSIYSPTLLVAILWGMQMDASLFSHLQPFPYPCTETECKAENEGLVVDVKRRKNETMVPFTKLISNSNNTPCSTPKKVTQFSKQNQTRNLSIALTKIRERDDKIQQLQVKFDSHQ